jgi:drug/metabolite transporter (DMT)-like permease
VIRLSASSRSVAPPCRRWPPTDLDLLAASVGGMSLAAPLITEIHLPALSIALWRNVMAILAIAPTVVWQYRSERRPVAPGDLLRSAGGGGLFALYLALWLPSLALTSVASSTGLSFTAAPLWVLLIRRIRGAQVSLPAWIGTVAAFAGVLMLTGVDFSSPRHLAGDALALASGIAVPDTCW